MRPLRGLQETRVATREESGVLGFPSRRGLTPRGRGGFLPRHDEDLREPLVRRQGSQVSMRVARGSASWLSSHGRGLGAKLVNAGSTEMCSGPAGSPPTTVHIPPTGGGLEVHFLKWDMATSHTAWPKTPPKP